jgi:hypothetical protein
VESQLIVLILKKLAFCFEVRSAEEMKLAKNLPLADGDHFAIVYNYRQQANNKRRKTLRKDNYRKRKDMKAVAYIN